MRITTIILAVLVASALAYVGVSLNSDLADTYNVTMADNTTERYEAIQDESAVIAEDISQVQEWLQELTEGDIGGFVFAMPANVANVIGILLQLPNVAYSVLDSTLAIFGIPAYISGILSIMLIVVVTIIIVGIWTEGRV